MTVTPVMPLDTVVELRSAVADRLDDRQKIQLGNDVMHWSISNLLHGEQGAMSLSASLCHILLDPGAQEYAANQAREEARHVAGFTRYIAKRWGDPLPVGKTIATVLVDLVSTPEVYKKIVGMQMLIEGLAMGSFATLNAKTNDPVLRRLVQLVMSDEAFHHRFGRIWASKTIRHLNEDEHKKVEDWSAQIFQMLLFNLINAEQKQVIYAKYGLDWQWVRDAVKETFSDEDRRDQLKESTNIFRVLIKTLLHAGIITAAHRAALCGVGRHEGARGRGRGHPGRCRGRGDAGGAARDQRQEEAHLVEGRREGRELTAPAGTVGAGASRVKRRYERARCRSCQSKGRPTYATTLRTTVKTETPQGILAPRRGSRIFVGATTACGEPLWDDSKMLA